MGSLLPPPGSATMVQVLSHLWKKYYNSLPQKVLIIFSDGNSFWQSVASVSSKGYTPISTPYELVTMLQLLNSNSSKSRRTKRVSVTICYYGNQRISSSQETKGDALVSLLSKKLVGLLMCICNCFVVDIIKGCNVLMQKQCIIFLMCLLLFLCRVQSVSIFLCFIPRLHS